VFGSENVQNILTRSVIIYDFIEIGTSDFETLLQTTPEGSIGLSVDANKIYLDRLPVKPSVIKVNTAVSDKIGARNLPLYFVSHGNITQHKLPDWLRGCSQVGVPHALLISELKSRNLQHLMESRSVPVITFSELLYNYNASAVKYLKVDAERHSIEIMQGVVKTCKSRPSLCPGVISFESWAGTNAEIHFQGQKNDYLHRAKKVEKALRALGYLYIGSIAEDKHFVRMSTTKQ
jgi:hypothetical protein